MPNQHRIRAYLRSDIWANIRMLCPRILGNRAAQSISISISRHHRLAASSANPFPVTSNVVMDAAEIKSTVKEYYGQTLQTSNDLKTSACKTCVPLPKAITELLKAVPREVREAPCCACMGERTWSMRRPSPACT